MTAELDIGDIKARPATNIEGSLVQAISTCNECLTGTMMLNRITNTVKCNDCGHSYPCKLDGSPLEENWT